MKDKGWVYDRGQVILPLSPFPTLSQLYDFIHDIMVLVNNAKSTIGSLICFFANPYSIFHQQSSGLQEH
jgi:hypothetical protein